MTRPGQPYTSTARAVAAAAQEVIDAAPAPRTPVLDALVLVVGIAYCGLVSVVMAGWLA